jgi:NhaP-type Na+/H+ or K+/H+ antiporter
MHDILISFALIAAVLMFSGIISGFVRRVPFSVPMIFLGLGLLLGGGAFGVLQVDAHDRSLEVVGILSLTFVLFLDAVNLRLDASRATWRVLLLALGPGTFLTVGLIAAGAMFILGMSLLEALLLGSILASIDPVVLREVVRDERVPSSIRQALTTEAGSNDIIVLPLILILATILRNRPSESPDWIPKLVQIFILGPLAGVIVGLAAVWLMRQVRARTTIEREYRAVFGVGTVLAAYVAGEAVGGSGFLAILAGGAAVVATDYDMCDCLLEYGEITADILMLLAFTLFGALLSSLAGPLMLAPVLLFAVVVIVIARPLAIAIVLRRAVVSKRARLFIGWFGPRGLSSLLFALLVVSRGVPGSERMLAITGVVVIVSVVAHGVSAKPLTDLYVRTLNRQTLPEEREATATGLFMPEATTVPRITPEELAMRLEGPNPPIVLDVRTRSTRGTNAMGIPGSVRVPPGEIDDWAARNSPGRPVVTYCT